jgi:predicted nucleic acid-binding protein
VTLIDTSVIIDYLSGDQKIITLIKQILAKEEVKTTTISEYELLRHKARIRKQAAERFLSGATVYSFDREAAQAAATLFQELQETGKMVNENDLLIAGIALAYGEILLTRDQKLASISKDNIKTV